MIETEHRIRHDALAKVLRVSESVVTKAIECSDVSQTDRCEHFTHELRGGRLYYRVSESGVRAIMCALNRPCWQRRLKSVLRMFSEARRAHANAAFLK